jgi:preprotein translocase subunit SecD
MQQRNTAWLILIFILVLGAVYVVVPGTGIPQIGTIIPETKYTIRQGLDLQGGLQVLLEADVPPGTELDSHAMDTAKTIVEQRVNGLGVTEPLVQRQGASRIVVELPGVTDPQAAIDLLKQTGLLEFVYAGTQFLPADTVVKTDCVDPSRVDCGTGEGTTTPPAPTAAATATIGATATSATATPLRDHRHDHRGRPHPGAGGGRFGDAQRKPDDGAFRPGLSHRHDWRGLEERRRRHDDRAGRG